MPGLSMAARYAPARGGGAADEASGWNVRPSTPRWTWAAPAYSIVIPPPNVTGSLHMGHALNGTIQDVLIRYHRMRGANTMWLVGTDHAGIATQNKVEARLADEGLRKEDLGREEFAERVWAWKREHGSTIIHQLKKLGCACDYERERFTMDEAYHEAVVRVFVDLYPQGRHLSRCLSGELVPAMWLGHLRPRSGARGAGGQTLLRHLSGGGRGSGPDGGHYPSGDHTCRHGCGGQPR